MTTKFCKETGKAWGIDYKKVQELATWIEENVPSHYQSKVFTNLLRRYRNSNKTNK